MNKWVIRIQNVRIYNFNHFNYIIQIIFLIFQYVSNILVYLNFAGMTAGGESDIGSVDGMMPDDVEAAYQVILLTLFIYATTGKLKW